MTGGPCMDEAQRQLLSRYALGRLASAEAAATGRHLVRCTACQADVASLRRVAAALDLLTPADVAAILTGNPVGRTPAPSALPPNRPARRVGCRFVAIGPGRGANRSRPGPVRRTGRISDAAREGPPGSAGEC